MPLVSVVIPVYNQEAYVEEAIASALGQTFADLEIIAVNDGSTDGTAMCLARYAGRVRIVTKDNGGTPSALNLGIEHAMGKYVAWLSADDVFLPDKLALQVEAMRRCPTAGLCYTDWYVIDAAGNITSRSGSPTFADRDAAIDGLLQCCCINGSTVIMLRSALMRVGPFNAAYRQAHDYDMWLRFAKYYDFVHVERPLLKYRWHGSNLSQQPDALSYNAEILARARILHGR